ncbi:MAG: N-acetyl-L-ornithine deacetylase ArgE [Patescibacteria group bacterium]|nr:N-acetyl-L-ornithine deacetylase ArgE [Patescibacteria group bacterium]MBU1952867.1 N-acetyl-L-ornithine deacetylase ArgE [Patescibacteria group bacterium]
MQNLNNITKPFDIDTFLTIQSDVSESAGYKNTCLGMVDKYPITLLSPKRAHKSKPHILIAGGFHGEEPAGCWGILKFLKTEKENATKQANISFLPLVNPTGFAVGCPYNKYGENAALGFCPPSTEPLSKEGLILMNNLDLLLSCAKDCFISLHEEPAEKDGFYLYTFENSKTPGKFTQTLLDVGTQQFQIIKDCEIEGSIIKDGLSFNEHDGTFEDFMFSRGVPKCACTETPGKNDINKRVETNRLIIKSTADYFAI